MTQAKIKIAAVILSAGEGSRMGGNKALLRFGGQTFLERVSEAIWDSGVCEDVVVVTGHDHEKVSDEAMRLQLKSVFNPDSKAGLMTSLQVGLREVSKNADALLVVLVDQPLIDGSFIRSFVEAYSNRMDQYSLARPFYQGRPGHPSLIRSEHFEAIASRTPTDEGANFLFKQFPDRVFRFDTENRAAATDIDTVDDLRGLLNPPL